MNRISFLPLFLICSLLLGSCLNTNKIQYQKVRSSEKSTYTKTHSKKEIETSILQLDVQDEIEASRMASENTEFIELNLPNNEGNIALHSEKKIDKEKEILHQRLHTVHQKQSLKKDDEPNEDKAVTPKYRKLFNFYHWLILGFFLMGLVFLTLVFMTLQWVFAISFVLACVVVYVFSVLQLINAKKKIPLEERDKSFRRKFAFAWFMFILGSILLAVTLIWVFLFNVVL